MVFHKYSFARKVGKKDYRDLGRLFPFVVSFIDLVSGRTE